MGDSVHSGLVGEDESSRVVVEGKFLRWKGQNFFVRGFSYGPFSPNGDGEPLPDQEQVRRDFGHMCQLGANTIRVYFSPPRWLLDEARVQGLFVFVDVPWQKHRCFFEDWDAMQEARERVRETARKIGDHPAVLAISVVNEFPVDIVRYQGRRRVEKFVEELIEIVRQESSGCLATFVNYPTTEFLAVNGCDFTCFNVYLHEESQLGLYLDRLQHIAGNQPLVLGEYGIDSKSEGSVAQAEILLRHLTQVFRHGLAGSVVFAYTDDWFTGGHQVEDWFFGVTKVDRSEKPAAGALRDSWTSMPAFAAWCDDRPRISVVVCSYNGSKTLAACLDSLERVDYPDYEVLLIDDGSTDNTVEIAKQYPSVRYYHQENRGLSSARNVGAELATGEIVAYTDDDCVVDTLWLAYLVQGMHDQKVEAIGGPNITPQNDGWVARCVAASPGNPSHVMLDDRRAEHVPGCNMAFRRSTLLGIGGFDEQFRVAGDDVDVCWRFLDAGLRIGYAPGAMVWHHRRASVRAYANQQRGYGRSEAMVHFKHPQRCGLFGQSNWNGIIYGDGAVGLPLMPDRIYHGRFGGAPFQTIYRHNHYGFWSVVLSFEWQVAALFFLVLATVFPLLGAIAAGFWLASAAHALSSGLNAPLPRDAPWWCRPLVAYLYFMQPIWRGWNRLTHLLRSKRLPRPIKVRKGEEIKRVSCRVLDLYWDDHNALGRNELLDSLVQKSHAEGWAGDSDNAWADWDLKLVGDCWHDITICVATEELGWPRRFTRARCELHTTPFFKTFVGLLIIWCLVAMAGNSIWGMGLGLLFCLFVLTRSMQSRRSCLEGAAGLVSSASAEAGFSHVGVDEAAPAVSPGPILADEKVVSGAATGESVTGAELRAPTDEHLSEDQSESATRGDQSIS